MTAQAASTPGTCWCCKGDYKVGDMVLTLVGGYIAHFKCMAFDWMDEACSGCGCALVEGQCGCEAVT